MDNIEIMVCPVCGGKLKELYVGCCRCGYCGGIFTDEDVNRETNALCGLLDEGETGRFYVARKNLYDAMHAERVSSDECIMYGNAIKGLVPVDYLADFAIAANSEGGAGASAFLNGSSEEDMRVYAPTVLDFMLRFLSPRTCAAVGTYIERAFSRTSDEYKKYIGVYNETAEKVNPGVFSDWVSRDAFIACSSRDMVKAAELCDYLEANGITCFLPSRNIRRGSNLIMVGYPGRVVQAMGTADEELMRAMDCCDTFVFVSSRASRGNESDVLWELTYVEHPELFFEGNDDYPIISADTPKHRVEYLIEDYTGAADEEKVNEFFSGQGQAVTKEEVKEKILNISGTIDTLTIDYGDYPEAIRPLLKSALDGDADVQWHIGDCYESGRDAPKNYDEAVKWYRMAAEQGHIEAEMSLGKCYSEGYGVEQDHAEAMKWCLKAAEHGNAGAELIIGKHYHYGVVVEQDHAEAMKWYLKAAEHEHGYSSLWETIGDWYYNGDGVEQDYAEAVKWYHKAAEQGEGVEQIFGSVKHKLGDCYFYGIGVEQDYAEAVKWYRKATERGDSYAENMLGDCYYYGNGIDQDYAEAAKWYREAAEWGNKRAQNSLGICYSKGIGVKQDYAEAAKWYRKAVEQGDVYAQHNLGNCYYYGRGVEQDRVEAARWYRKAAEQGHAAAQCSLGNCFYFGDGVEQDLAEAARWFRKSAEQGYAGAQNNLGSCYYIGEGVEQDLAEAARWYRKSAEQGFAAAQCGLGNCFYHGDGVEQDLAEAARWYRKSAEQGYAGAQFNLGICFYFGNGVEQDLAEAVRWLRKSADQGIEEAEEVLKEIRAGENESVARRARTDDRPLDYMRCYRYVESDMMPGVLSRGDARFTSSLTLYLAGSNEFGWDYWKRSGFGQRSSVYANKATKESFGVWCPCNNNLCFSEIELREKGIRDYVYDDRIVEHMYDVRKQDLGRFDNEDVRVTFVRIKKPKGSNFIYMFYGLVKCVNIEYEDYGGIRKNHMIRTFKLISDRYPDPSIKPLGGYRDK